jgi:hypothetical protein
VADFVTTSPKPRAAILEAARPVGLSENKVKTLLAAAESEGRVYRWRYGPSDPAKYSTVKQPDLGGEKND